MPKKERLAKQAAFAMSKELDSEMTDEQRERMEKSGMGVGGGIDKGEATLFGARRRPSLQPQLQPPPPPQPPRPPQPPQPPQRRGSRELSGALRGLGPWSGVGGRTP